MLRHAGQSLGNINDFLLLAFIDMAREQGYSHLNMGLCPLVGLEDADAATGGIINSVLRFAYSNGDRIYSFSGLHRFKAKYEPEWRSRYIAYKNGLPGFTRTANALVRAMRVK
jgi:phosphatidylglycerol lysyltransferase